MYKRSAPRISSPYKTPLIHLHQYLLFANRRSFCQHPLIGMLSTCLLLGPTRFEGGFPIKPIFSAPSR